MNNYIKRKVLTEIKNYKGGKSKDSLKLKLRQDDNITMKPEQILQFMHVKNKIILDGHYVRLAPKGYQFFDPWHKKFWRFFTNDMAKILSIISTFK